MKKIKFDFFPWVVGLLFLKSLFIMFKEYGRDPIIFMEIFPYFAIPAAILLFLFRKFIKHHQLKVIQEHNAYQNQKSKWLSHLMDESEITKINHFMDTAIYILACYGVTDIPETDSIKKNLYPFYIANTGYFIAKYYYNDQPNFMDVRKINTEETRSKSTFVSGPTERLELALQEYLIEILPYSKNMDRYLSFNAINDLCTDKERGNPPEQIVNILRLPVVIPYVKA